MNTYIIEAYNKDGYEWIDHEPLIETITAASLDEALSEFSTMQLVWEQLDDRTLEYDDEDLFPIELSILCVPQIGLELDSSTVKAAVKSRLDYYRREIKILAAQAELTAERKQKNIDHIKEEMKRLGLTVRDLCVKV